MTRPYNATIRADAGRLDVPLATLHARQYAAFRALVTDVPGDLSGVFLRLHSSDGASYLDFAAVPVPETESPDSWRVAIPSSALSDVGRRRYELHASWDDGDMAALGCGDFVTEAFSAGGSAPSSGEAVAVAQMPVKGDGWVNCVAVMDETGEYTYEFEKVDGTEDAQ